MAGVDILAKYGIKEVADVVFYELSEAGKPTKPVLYLDTLKFLLSNRPLRVLMLVVVRAMPLLFLGTMVRKLMRLLKMLFSLLSPWPLCLVMVKL